MAVFRRYFLAGIWVFLTSGVFGPRALAQASAAPVTAAPAADFSLTGPSASQGEGPSQPLSSAAGDYILSAGDTIELNIFREPDLTTRSIIARDGTVQLPLIGEVTIAGLTVREGRDLLRKLYDADYLVEPQVYLSVTQFALRKFTVMGQVARPGSFELQGGESLDLLQAIGMAGGFTRIADQGRILVKRKVEGKIKTLKVNAKRMAGDNSATFQILPGDVITVREAWF